MACCPPFRAGSTSSACKQRFCVPVFSCLTHLLVVGSAQHSSGVGSGRRQRRAQKGTEARERATDKPASTASPAPDGYGPHRLSVASRYSRGDFDDSGSEGRRSLLPRLAGRRPGLKTSFRTLSAEAPASAVGRHINDFCLRRAPLLLFSACSLPSAFSSAIKFAAASALPAHSS